LENMPNTSFQVDEWINKQTNKQMIAQLVNG
jgi:hypothetical protein